MNIGCNSGNKRVRNMTNMDTINGKQDCVHDGQPGCMPCFGIKRHGLTPTCCGALLRWLPQPGHHCALEGAAARRRCLCVMRLTLAWDIECSHPCPAHRSPASGNIENTVIRSPHGVSRNCKAYVHVKSLLLTRSSLPIPGACAERTRSCLLWAAAPEM